MIQRIREFIQLHKLIVQGDVVCVGLSGGADSVCLCMLLDTLKAEFDFELRAFHVNHHLRGEESLEDERFVKDFCSKRNIPLYLYEHDVKSFSEQMGCGTEEAGRILRIQDAKECLQNGCTKIALAHHKNDQAETLLFNLTRGCSLTGMTSIRPASGSVIHPMLCFSRNEILEFLNMHQTSFRTDSTNEDTSYTRNYIRHIILPALEKDVNSRSVEHLAQAADDMIRIKYIIDTLTNTAQNKHTIREEERILLKRSLLQEDEYIIHNVILRSLQILSGKSKDINRIHLESVSRLFYAQSGTAVFLPFDLQAEASYGDLIIRVRQIVEPVEIPFTPCKRIQVKGITLSSEWISDPSELINKKNEYTKCFDYDRISDSCVIRTRKPGDRIMIGKNGDLKKLKDFFIDIKMERSRRDNVLLLAAGNLVHWVIGYRMGESAKVTDETRRFLKISIDKEPEDED